LNYWRPTVASGLGNATETQDADVCIMICPKCWVDYNTHICTLCQELMKSAGCHGSMAMLFVDAICDESDGLTIVSNSQKAMTTVIGCVMFKVLWRFLC
jgi:hypothetical protein